jgi:hypothetical protein
VSVIEAGEIIFFKCISFTHEEFSGFVDWIGMFCVQMSDNARWLRSFISQNSRTNDTLKSWQLVSVSALYGTKFQIALQVLTSDCRIFLLHAAVFPSFCTSCRSLCRLEVDQSLFVASQTPSIRDFLTPKLNKAPCLLFILEFKSVGLLALPSLYTNFSRYRAPYLLFILISAGTGHLSFSLY